MESPLAFSEALVERIRQRLAQRKNVEEKKMFGGVGFQINGNLVVGVWKELDITGKPMKGWLLVEPEGVEDDEQLKDWIQRAVKFVGALPAKEK